MNFTILLTKSKIGLKPCTTVLIMNFHTAFKAMIPKDIIIMTMNVMVHIWAQKLITYFKTVFVGWLLSVMPCRLLTVTPPLVGPRVPEVLTAVLLPTKRDWLKLRSWLWKYCQHKPAVMERITIKNSGWMSNTFIQGLTAWLLSRGWGTSRYTHLQHKSIAVLYGNNKKSQ